MVYYDQYGLSQKMFSLNIKHDCILNEKGYIKSKRIHCCLVARLYDPHKASFHISASGKS